jgi:hypothetical protein
VKSQEKEEEGEGEIEHKEDEKSKEERTQKKPGCPSYPFRAQALHFSEPGHPNTLRIRE